VDTMFPYCCLNCDYKVITYFSNIQIPGFFKY
jgi:hypothetical protein